MSDATPAESYIAPEDRLPPSGLVEFSVGQIPRDQLIYLAGRLSISPTTLIQFAPVIERDVNLGNGLYVWRIYWVAGVPAGVRPDATHHHPFNCVSPEDYDAVLKAFHESREPPLVIDFNDRGKLDTVRLREPLSALNLRGAILTPPHQTLYARRLPPPTKKQYSINMALLLFDDFDFPKSNAYFYASADFSYLIESGLVRQSEVVWETVRPSSTPLSFYEVYVAMEQREPNRWTVVRDAGAHGFPDHLLKPDQSFALKLYDALPIPDRDVPLDDVLNFKVKRMDQLWALRLYMDELRLDILKHPDTPFAERVAIQRFDQALSQWAQVMREPNWKKVLASLEVSVAWDKAVPALITGAGAIATGLPLTSTVLSTLGGFVASLGMSSVKGLIGAQRGSAFEYITSVNRALF